MGLKKYKRIIVLGSGGSGKTTLAKFISKKTSLPIVYLDKEYWLPNWEKPDFEQWQKKLTNLVGADEWVMDGNYIDTLDIRLERADLVIMLDIKSSTCVNSIFFRTLKGYFIKRKDINDGCRDKFDAKYTRFIKWVKQFKSVYFSQLIELCLQYPHLDVKLFTKRKNAKKFIKKIKKLYHNNEK